LKIVKKIKELREITEIAGKKGLSIGLVPTMGFLHAGHLSLIERAKRENDLVVVSVFVNPIQFCPGEDFEKYPRDMDHDAKECEKAGADVVFAPETEEMYPVQNLAYVDISKLGDGLCGARRPGHFRGVCTVVSKLFNIVSPDRAYFGEKDAQQLAVIKRMVIDLNFKTQIVACPIVRDQDGLAISSRNVYLSPEERTAALVISKSLRRARESMLNGERDAAKIRKAIIDEISSEPLARIDYVEVVDAETLEPVSEIKGSVLTAAAVYIGATRLIDNFTFKGE
jgi:pantoate--beta-alanine ligase